MPTYLFVNTTGGATFSSERMEGDEPDCENMQSLGSAEGETAKEAWQALLKDGETAARLFADEGIMAYEFVDIHHIQ